MKLNTRLREIALDEAKKWQYLWETEEHSALLEESLRASLGAHLRQVALDMAAAHAQRAIRDHLEEISSRVFARWLEETKLPDPTQQIQETIAAVIEEVDGKILRYSREEATKFANAEFRREWQRRLRNGLIRAFADRIETVDPRVDV